MGGIRTARAAGAGREDFFRIRDGNTKGEQLIQIYAADLLFILAYGAYFLLPVHLRELGATNAGIGAITAATGVTNTAALFWLLASGYRKDPKVLMKMGLLAFGAGCAGMLLTDDFVAIAGMRMLHGAGFCLFFIAANTWVSFHVPTESLARNIGYLGVVTLLAQSVAPALAEGIARSVGFPLLFGLTVGLVALSYLIVGMLPATAPEPDSPAGPERVTSQPRLSMLSLAALALLGGALFGAVLTFSPLHLLEIKVVPVSLFFIVYAISAVLVRVALKDAADTKGHLATARICFLLLAISVFAMSYSNSAFTFGAASALFGMGHGLMYPALAAYSVNAVKGARIRGMSVWAGGFAIGVSLGAWAAGLVAEIYPILTVFRICAVFPLGAAVLLSFMREPSKASPSVGK